MEKVWFNMRNSHSIKGGPYDLPKLKETTWNGQLQRQTVYST